MFDNFVTLDESDPHAVQASEVNGTARDRIAAIKADRNLSDEGKASEIAQIRDRANTKIAELEAASQAAAEEAMSKARDRVFKPRVPYNATASDRIAITAAYRDAMDRAASVQNPRDLHEMLDRAHMTGDDIAARGILAVALQRRDAATVDAFSVLYPGNDDEILTYWNLSDRDQSLAASFGRAATFARLR